MASIIESIILSISAQVSGAAGVAGLTGNIGGLSQKLLGLNAGLQIVQQVTGAISGMVATMGDYAAKADGAAVSARSWQVVLERFNVDAKSAGEAISELSQRTGASEMSLKSAAAQYIKMGGTLEDFSKVALAASSSWYDLTVKSISLDDAINNVSTGVASGRSELLESSGVMLNASQAYKRYSDEIGKSVDKMSDAEKAHAYAIGVFKEEQIGIETLTEKQTELSRAKNAETQASDRLAEVIGRNLIPLQVKLTQTSAEVQRTLTQMFDAYQQGGDALKVLTDKYPQLGRALTTLKPIMDAVGRAGREVFAALADSARNLMPVVESLRPLFERVWNAIPGLIEKAGRVISETFHAINDLWKNVLKPVWDSLQPALGAAVDGIIKNLNDMLDYMDGMVTTVRALINGDWKGAWETFSEAVSKAYASVKENLQKIDEVYQEWEKNAIASVFESAKNIGLNIKDGIIAGITDLSLELSEKVEAAITGMTDRLPQWVKDRMGLDGLKDALNSAQSGAVDSAQAARARSAGRAPEIDPKTLNDFQKLILDASKTGRGQDGRNDDIADQLVNYCARWVRDTLGDAAPEMRAQIDKLFQSNPEIYTDENGRTKKSPTARSAYANFDKAGLAKDYKTYADLKEGDTVFYVDGGQNHVGTYIGNAQVRGNNRVSFKDSGGKDPVGDVDINRLGKVTGYVAASELLAYLKGNTPVTGTPKLGDAGIGAGAKAGIAGGRVNDTPPDTTDKGGPFTAAQYEKARQLIADLEKADKASKAAPGNVALANAFTAAGAASEKFSKSSLSAADALKAAQSALGGTKKAADAYIATLSDFQDYGNAALLLIKEQERVTTSGTAAEREAVRGRVLGFQKQGDAQAAVFDAESAAYQSRKQAAAEANRAGEEAAALSVRLGEETAAEAKRKQEEAKQLASELSSLKIESATATAGRLKAIDDDIYRRAEGDAQRQLELVRKSSQAEYDRVQQIAIATRKLAYQDAAGQPNGAAMRDAAQAKYLETVETARITRLGQVRTAQDTVSKSLEDGVRAGNAALDSLDKLNLGGRDLVDTAQKLPETRAQFDTLYARIVALRGQLAEPGVVDAWTQSITDMGKAGQLSAVQVQALLEIIKDLNGPRDVQKADNLQGRGVVQEAATNDAARGTLASGEAERLLTNMIGMDPAELGAILADLVAKGFGESDLGKLIRAQLAGSDFSELALMVTENGAQRFQTDDELRGIGQPAEKATVAYLNLESVIQDIGQFSPTELEALISQTGLLTDEANKLRDAWAAVYGQFEKGAQGSDATAGPGKGLLNNARPDDVSQGTLAPGEADRLLTAMIGMDPVELGGILADLVAQGFGESDLARLIRGQIQDTAAAIDASLREFGGVGVDVNTGEQTFQSDDELSGKGVRATETGQSFIDLASIIENVGTLSRDELDALLAKAKLLPDQIDQITRAWEELAGTVEGANIAALDEQLAPIAVNLQSVFGRLESGAQTAGEARVELAGLRSQLEGIGGPAAQNLIGVIDEAVQGFDSLGNVSADVTSALAKLRGEAEKPYDGLIRKLQQMRTEPGAATAEIDALILSLQKLNGNAAKAQGIEKMTAKINEFADYAKKSIPLVTSAFQALGGASDEVAAGWGDSLGRMIDDVVNFATAIAKGDYIGAAIQGLTSIFTFFARKAQEARAEMKKTEDYNKGFKFDADGYGTRKTTSTTTGILFWKKTVVTEQIDEAGKQMALTFENAVTGGVGSGLAAAVASNDSSILEKAILTNLKNAALQGLTEAFLASGTVVAVIGPLIQKLIAAFKSGNTENIRAAVADFRDGVKSLKGEMDGLVEAGKIVSDELGGAGESFASSFSDSIRSGVRALLSGQSPLQALYDDVRGKIETAVVNGFFVQAALDKLQPFLDGLKAKLDAGLDPTQAIAQIGAQLPGISAQLQVELGPLVAALNTYLPNALNANTSALNGNTAALKESQFQTTVIASYADVGRPSNVRQQLAGL